MRILKTLVALAVLGAAVVPVAAGAEGAIRANVPFEFTAGGVALPPGNYQFERQNNSHSMAVWNLDRRTTILVLGHVAYERPRANVTSRVVFNKYGNQYFLAEVWSAANATGTRVSKSHEEREASLKASAQSVLVAAK